MSIALLFVTAFATEWQKPPEEVLAVLHAPQLPWVWTSPSGGHLLLADPVSYPPLSEYAAGWYELAGMRVDPGGGYHGNHGGTNPRLQAVGSDAVVPLGVPAGAEVQGAAWTADGERFALTVRDGDVFSVWVGDVKGGLEKLDGLEVNRLMARTVAWMPDQKHLLVRTVPEGRGEMPAAPVIPAGPRVTEGSGDKARSTYESRNLLKTAHDDELFDHFTTAQLVLVDPRKGKRTNLGAPGVYAGATPSPDGKYLLVERLVRPWSHDVGWYRFAHEVEVWDKKGEKVATVASLPLADEVPAHGVPTGVREVSWVTTEPHTLVWLEALDGGNPVAEVPHRDRLMKLEAPYTAAPKEVLKLQHRVVDWAFTEDGTMVLTEWERMRRWQYTRLVNLGKGTMKPWFDINEDDRYASPGDPVYRLLDNGKWVLHQEGDSIYFSGRGATPQGDRPFLDLRKIGTDKVTRLFRSPADRYEQFIDMLPDGRFVMRSESAVDVPNYHLVTLGGKVDAAAGEATRSRTSTPITKFEDPTPQLRAMEKKIVTYERADGVPLSFHLYLPPGYEPGKPLPTVVEAYPLEYSDASMAGQVSGSTQRFDRLWGASHLFFALQGYAVLDSTAMPMVGDPETVYDTFVPQMVADAEAAVAKAVEMGIADPDRIGIIGHSHGGLMVANLLAHTDLFKAGIARSGSYNKTNQPFGFQSERRSLFEARDVYIQVSPTFFADKVNEPVLVIHGAADSNPGTLTFQSEVFFEAVRGSGGTARLVLLPFEDHGYRAKESIEHVLWEQLEWFDTHLRGK
ncbi:MAG: S9 family peptidase [Alphaproteobacteria bacterium]|nr:S9 family peptidase [Alphaproteobacteria bacterium]MCB9692063.1 S9 family peptidase [Alphaproteobacteria bacterium]